MLEYCFAKAHLAGKPSYSTITNQRSLREYIELRKREYRLSKPEYFPTKARPSTDEQLDLSELDPYTRRKVLNIIQQNKMLENMLADLTERAINNSRKHPIRVADAIRLGPDPKNGSLQLPNNFTSNTNKRNRTENTDISDDNSNIDITLVINIIKRLLDLVEIDDPNRTRATLFWEYISDDRILTAEWNGGEQEMLISPKELTELNLLLTKVC